MHEIKGHEEEEEEDRNGICKGLKDNIYGKQGSLCLIRHQTIWNSNPASISLEESEELQTEVSQSSVTRKN
jgi:hypothetical protein